MSDPLPLPITQVPDDTTVFAALDLVKTKVAEWGEGVLQDVRWHPGQFSLRAFREQGIKTPAIVVAVLDADSEKISNGRSVQFSYEWVAYVVTEGVLRDRAALGLGIGEELAKFAHRNAWGGTDPFSKPPTNVRGPTSLYADQDEREGASIWVVRWTQTIDAGSAGFTPLPLETLLTIRGVVSSGNDPDANAEVEIE